MKSRHVGFVHVCVRAERCLVRLTDHRFAPWLWQRLRRTFPHAIAVVLMPNHIHVLTPAASESEARRALGRVIAALRKSHNPGALNRWSPAASQGVFTDPQKIARQMRYIVLNPCRAGLVSCPAEWLWSTHRDVLGAVADPWCTADKLAAALGRSAAGLVARHHDYVSGDPSTHVGGTPLPCPHDADPAGYSLHSAVAAATAAVRGELRAVRRRGEARNQLLALGCHARWRPSCLAETTGLTTSAVCYHFRQRPRVTAATLMCLGDARLTAYLAQTEADICELVKLAPGVAV